jgi:hypothetical protein
MTGPWGSTRLFRWALVLVSSAIAALLIARGELVIGGLIAACVALRIGLLLSTTRRRGLRGVQRESIALRRLLPGIARREFQVAAGIIGVNADELRRGFQQGRSIAQAAAAAGIATPIIVDAVVNDASAMLDRAVTEGSISPDRAIRAKATLPTWASRLVQGTT